MADFSIDSLRGGMNDSDPPSALPDDQCVLAQNVEFVDSRLGERRKGSAVVSHTLGGSYDEVTFLHRHLPTTDEADAELWVLAKTDAGGHTLVRKTTSWSSVTVPDTPDISGIHPYRWAAQSLHGKLFLAYKSSASRLHVWDGSAIRRTGLAQPDAPTVANTGTGSYSGTRYFRVRFTVQVSGTTTLRSEPSATTTFVPSGSGAAARITKPASISESETHWEVEASLDNANFYRIATVVVGTTTYDDSTPYSTGYATNPLSEDVGDYTLLPSARYLAADQDRLLFGGDWETTARSSRVGWTPVLGSTGVGNDERTEADTTPFLDLDGFEGGALTGLVSGVNGATWAFKLSHVYKLVRTGRRSQAYEAVVISKERGAIHGSVVQGVDQAGRPCLYFLDPAVGPCRLGTGGLQWCGKDIRATWRTINLDASKVVATGWFYPEKNQVHWTIATGTNNVPNLQLVLQTDETIDTPQGVRRGWATWTGTPAGALTSCLFADNIDAGVARSRLLRPFVGTDGGPLILRMDTGTTDDGTAFAATIRTKPYLLAGLLRKFGTMAATLLAKAASGITLDVRLVRDFGKETKTVAGVNLAPSGAETQVIRELDNFSMSEMAAIQVEFLDPASPAGRWELNQFMLKEREEQTA